MNEQQIADFWSRATKTDTCWVWQGNGRTTGRPRFAVSGRPHEAHRIAYELTVGTLSSDAMIQRTCGNTLCVRPDHLQIIPTFTERQKYLHTTNETGSVRTIPLTQGQVALVSSEDYEWLMQWQWCYNPAIQRAYRHIKSHGKVKTVDRSGRGGRADRIWRRLWLCRACWKRQVAK